MNYKNTNLEKDIYFKNNNLTTDFFKIEKITKKYNKKYILMSLFFILLILVIYIPLLINVIHTQSDINVLKNHNFISNLCKIMTPLNFTLIIGVFIKNLFKKNKEPYFDLYCFIGALIIFYYPDFINSIYQFKIVL